ncbi:MAG: hypothetical protein H0V89_13645 [Deltaproteobacteria bacterium]|nr:hypothetical protein [Deltaproteobacteria bacterium]
MTTYAVELAAIELGSRPFQRVGREICAGRPDGSLASAVEIYSRKGGRSTWGHLSVRFLGCRGGDLVDAEYEFYRFDRTTPEVLAEWLPSAEILRDPDWTRRQRGAMVVYRNEHPADDGDFQVSALDNREIYELWIRQTAADRDAWWAAMEVAWTTQIATMDAGADLPDRYRPTTDNCTMPARVAFGEITGLPHAWKRWLFRQDLVERQVLYPSAWALRKLARRAGGVEGVGGLEVRALHPVLRWGRQLPEGTESLSGRWGPTTWPDREQAEAACDSCTP